MKIKNLALLSAFLALPAAAQGTVKLPVTDVAPKRTFFSVEAGPSSVSTPSPEDTSIDHPTIELYGTARVNFSGYFSNDRIRVIAYGELDRVTDGSAFSIADFKSVRGARGKAAVFYKIQNWPVSIGAVGGLNWSLEHAKMRDPQNWDFGGVLLLERFNWWPNGGVAGIGLGRWEGRNGMRFEVRQPLESHTAAYVKFTVPFEKLPDFLRKLPGAVTTIPVTGQPPTLQEIAGIRQRLPVSVSVGVLVTLKEF